jgi:phage baseplate assembly protein V
LNEHDRYTLNDLDRRLANMIREGTITEVDLEAKKAKVEIGDIITEWLQWGVRRAGKNRDWHAPDVGEQVVVFSPGGDLSQGIIGPSLWQDEFPANGNEATYERITIDEDGKYIVTIGGMTIEVTKDLAKLGASANNFVALANLVKAELDKIAAAFVSFVPGTGGASFGNPYTLASDVAATKVKAE